jgi:hypothetical protein
MFIDDETHKFKLKFVEKILQLNLELCHPWSLNLWYNQVVFLRTGEFNSFGFQMIIIDYLFE